MKPSLLQLESITFQKVIVEAQSNPCAGADIQVTDSIELFQNEADANRWRIELTLKIEPEIPEKLPGYLGEVCISGSFRVVGEMSKDTAANLVRVNGSSILYSAAREMFSNLTARGPHPLILLPGRSFIDLKINPPKVEQTSKQEVEKAGA